MRTSLLVCVCLLLVAGTQARIMTFLHVTDVHVDAKYKAGTPAHCIADDALSGLGCCNSDDLPSVTKPNHACSEWGDYNCDAPALWSDAAFKWIASNIPEIEFVILTGDFASHHDITQSPWENDGTILQITQQLASAFPGKLLYNVLGNHDGWPVDNTVPGIYEYMLAQISSYWAPYLGPNNQTAAQTFSKGGYYISEIVPGLQFISLNILFEDSNNVFFHKEQADLDWDPADMWSWLNTTLLAVRAKGEKVWIGFHFGPEAGESTNNYNVRLTQFMDSFQDVILQTFCGHTHSNSLYIYATHDGRPVQSAWAAGSLEASHHNPQFNVYHFDTDTFEIVEQDHYECDLNTTISNNSPACALAYKFTEAYNESNISLASALSVFKKLSTNSTLMQFYHHHSSPGDNYDNSDHPDSPCDSACAQGHLSDIFNSAPCPYPNVTITSSSATMQMSDVRPKLVNAALQPET
eukprot:c10194_g1_i1.p1 GENE.c10194_g1_i1~~c10194_g1_i1.p1  ORF type:complete len:466 (-),score=119.15 c10194_g1_i1:376-1773(-)